MCPQPAAEQVMSKTCIGGNPSPVGRSVEIPSLKQQKIWNLEQVQRTRTHTCIIIYGEFIIRLRPLKFQISWDTLGYVGTLATSVAQVTQEFLIELDPETRCLISQAAPTLRSEGGGTELLERS